LQVEPHFLFNALNTIVAEIADRPAIAEEMTRRLASYLRYSLARRHSGTCRLEEEVAALETYIGIQALRFGDRFEYRARIDPAALHASIPHMALQGLAENAIKHGMRADQRHFSINLRAWMADGALVVELDNPGTLDAPAEAARNGVGLDNLRQRLALHYPGRGRFVLEQRADRTVATLTVQGAPCHV
jgi:LytS/YehU family sensor histidine kinase